MSPVGLLLFLLMKISMKCLYVRCTHWLEYSPHGAYADSKLDIVLASWYLSEELRRETSPVTVNAVHPGVVNSSLYKHVHPAIKWLMDLLAKYTYKVCC